MSEKKKIIENVKIKLGIAVPNRTMIAKTQENSQVSEKKVTAKSKTTKK